MSHGISQDVSDGKEGNIYWDVISEGWFWVIAMLVSS